MLGDLIRQGLRRWRRGPRYPDPEYVLLLPEAYAQSLGSVYDEATELHAAGWLEGAAKALERLARGSSAKGGACALLGQVLLAAGHNPAANSALARARELEPRLVHDLIQAAKQAEDRGMRREALGGMLLASLLAPAEWRIKSRVADTYYTMGRLEQAVSWLDAAHRQSGRDSLLVKRLIMQFAPIYRSLEHLNEVRSRYLAGLSELGAAELHIENVLAEVNITNFYLPYQGMNERDTQNRLAALLLRASPDLGFIAPHCMRAPAARMPVRLAVASSFFGIKHSVGIAYNRLICSLGRRPDIELTAVCFSENAAAAMKLTLGDRGRTVVVPKTDLPTARRRLAELELDVLLYADVGMDPSTYYLAFGRYAPLQGVLGGHPLTTGIPNMDLYLSSELLEAPEAQDHYTEQLVKLRHLPLGMDAPPIPPARTREELGLPLGGNLYVCPLKLQKFHPEFDRALAGILDADADAEIVLFDDGQFDAWNGLVRERLARSLGRRMERVTFLPWQQEDFLPVVATCAVALDTFHFGAGTTAALTLGIGCPMVTLPSRFQRGRSTLGCYLAMNMRDCIASDLDDYVRIAVRIARDPVHRAALSEKLLALRGAIFETDPAARELGDVLVALFSERRSRLSARA
jgi:predicted O-linked N-acetylglucosamine transferase (SPINDLY family)